MRCRTEVSRRLPAVADEVTTRVTDDGIDVGGHGCRNHRIIGIRRRCGDRGYHGGFGCCGWLIGRFTRDRRFFGPGPAGFGAEPWPRRGNPAGGGKEGGGPWLFAPYFHAVGSPGSPRPPAP